MRIADTCRKPVIEKSSVTEPMIDEIKGLHFEYNNYFVRDVNGMEIHCVCPLCYARKRLISVLENIKEKDNPFLTLAYCPVCGTKFNITYWHMSDEAKKKINEFKENNKPTTAEIIARSLK